MAPTHATSLVTFISKATDDQSLPTLYSFTWRKQTKFSSHLASGTILPPSLTRIEISYAKKDGAALAPVFKGNG